MSLRTLQCEEDGKQGTTGKAVPEGVLRKPRSMWCPRRQEREALPEKEDQRW